MPVITCRSALLILAGLSCVSQTREWTQLWPHSLSSSGRWPRLIQLVVIWLREGACGEKGKGKWGAGEGKAFGGLGWELACCAADPRGGQIDPTSQGEQLQGLFKVCGYNSSHHNKGCGYREWDNYSPVLQTFHLSCHVGI